MPGSDDQYDQVHTYSQDHAGKSKTTKPAVREIGRDGAPVRLFVGEERDPTNIRSPPTGVRYLLFDQSGDLVRKNPDGTSNTVAKSGEEVQDIVGGMAGNAITYDDANGTVDVDETAISHDNLADVSTADHRTDENVQDTVGGILNEPLDYDDATPAVDVSLSSALAVNGGNLDVAADGIVQSMIDANSVGNTQMLDDAITPTEVDGSGGTDGQVLTSTGTEAQWESVGGNVPDWQEDGNSPTSVSGASSLSFTLSGTYDLVRVVLHDVVGSVNSQETLDLTVDGDTGSNYFFAEQDSTTTSNASNVPLRTISVANATGVSGSLMLGGRFTNGTHTGVPELGGVAGTGVLWYENNNISSPLDSFTLQYSSGNITGTVEVFGRDVG